MAKKVDHRKPTVSVVMPVYNAGAYLVPAIESILNQTFQDFELIIVDDASTDASWKTIRRFQKRYPKKIVAIQLKKNLNAGGDTCANIGLAFSQGTYIARMDADDIADPTRLEKQVAFLEANPKVFLVGSSAHVIDASGQIIGEKRVPSLHESIRKSFFSVHPMIHPTCMFRRLLSRKEPFRYWIKYNANNDYYSFFRLITDGYRFANLPDKLLYYRVHEKSATFQNLKGNFMNTVKIRLEMLNNYHYPATLKDLVIMSAQTGVVVLLPSAILTLVYVTVRGFRKPTFALRTERITPPSLFPVYKLAGKK